MTSFDTLVNKVLSREGGYVNNPDDKGGETNFGISKKSNPNVDIKNLTPEGAKAIYKSNYWDAIQGDSLPENIRDLAFDTAVHHGPGRAKQWLAASGGDPAKMLELRRAALQRQGKQAGQGQFVDGWMNRLAEFEGGAATPTVDPNGRVARLFKAPVPTITEVSAAARLGTLLEDHKPVGVVDWMQDVRSKEAARDAATFNQRVETENAPGFLVKVGAAMMGNTTGRIVDVLSQAAEDFEYDPDFVSPEADLKAATSQADLDELKQARNLKEHEWIKSRHQDVKDEAAVVFKNGMASGLGYSLLAGVADPVNLVAMYGAMTTFGNAGVQAVRAGQMGKAAVLMAKENLLAGTAIELGLQAAERRPSMQNFLLSATADIVLGGGIGAALGYAGKRGLAAAGLAERAALDHAARQRSAIEAAAAAAPPGTSPEQLAAMAARAQAEELEGVLVDSVRPLNTDRQLMARPDDGSEPVDPVAQNLRDKFAGSQAVDADGNPIKLYHGTTGDFKAFDGARMGEATGAPSAKEGWFFSSVPRVSDEYIKELNEAVASLKDVGVRMGQSGEAEVVSMAVPAAGERVFKEGANVMPVYVNLTNPIVHDFGGKPRNRSFAELLREAKENGHDGAIFRNVYDSGLDARVMSDVYVTFDGKQVKSAIANSGDYNFKVDDITLDSPNGKAGDASAEFKANVPDSAFTRSTDRLVVTNDIPEVLKDSITAIKNMMHLLPDNVRVAVGAIKSPAVRGIVSSGPGRVRIGLSEVGAFAGRGPETAMHEMTHVITDFYFPNASPAVREALFKDFAKFMDSAKKGEYEAVLMRWADAKKTPLGKKQIDLTNKYEVDFAEWMAEQGTRYFREDAARANVTGFEKGLVERMKEWMTNIYKWFSGARERGYLKPTDSFTKFMQDVQAKRIKPLDVPDRTAKYSTAGAKAADSVEGILTDPVARQYGMDLLPVSNATQRAEAKAMIALAKKAEEWAVANPKDKAWDARAENLITNPLFDAASTSLKMLRSENNITRMIASELLEDASGVAGKRQSTAAISKYLHQRHFMGNSLNDLQAGYAQWTKANGTGMIKDQFTGGKGWEMYNRQIAEEIEFRRTNEGPSGAPEYITKAADSIEASYGRAAKAQKDAKTLGHQALWENSRGYMPHRISPSKWLNLGNEQRRVLHTSLVEQFQTIEGWDISFADKLASDYLMRVQTRAVGGHDTPIGGASAGSASIIEDALLAMNMTPDEVRKNMQRFTRGAANFTKSRLDLDLLKTYKVGDKNFRLMDVFEVDQAMLLRGQVNRASGEVALARHGVYGKPGLQTIRNAMGYGPDGKRATAKELDAYDQVAAEFMDEPFGNAGPKWLDNARTLTSVTRLGGIVFNQFAEFVNGVSHLGTARVMNAMYDIPRLRKEIKALAKGEKINNPILNSTELIGGAEFGTDAYKIIMPFDMPGHAYQTYGADTVTGFDKLVRGASYAHSKISLWRAVHSVQQRGMAEQVVAKLARYTRDGGEDIALKQFGITPEIQAALRADGVAKWDAQGSLIEFDVTKMKDKALAEELIHAVHRGVSQIIQNTYIGETGKWAHDGYLKTLTQFRTFSLTSMEKQWGRQRNSRGYAQAAGILMASAAMVTPIYIARVYASSIGRADQEEYLDKRLAPGVVARQTMNYIAMSGMAPDFFDALAIVAPDEYGTMVTGARAGSPTGFVGSVVAPAAGLLDDAWKGFQQLDDPTKGMKALPYTRLPYVVPIINSFGD